jgi:hypothetical protein
MAHVQVPASLINARVTHDAGFKTDALCGYMSRARAGILLAGHRSVTFMARPAW